MKRLFLLIVFSLFFLAHQSCLASENIEDLDKTRMVVYNATYTNVVNDTVDILAEDEWVVVKQLEAYGFNKDKIFSSDVFYDHVIENYPEYKAQKAFQQEVSKHTTFLNGVNASAAEIYYMDVFLFNKYFPNTSRTAFLEKVGVTYKPYKKFSRSDRKIFKKHIKEILSQYSAVAYEYQQICWRNRPIDKRYELDINLNKYVSHKEKTVYDIYDDMQAAARRGYATYDELSDTIDEVNLMLNITSGYDILAYRFIDEDSLWNAISDKYDAARYKQEEKEIEEREAREAKYNI